MDKNIALCCKKRDQKLKGRVRIISLLAKNQKIRGYKI